MTNLASLPPERAARRVATAARLRLPAHPTARHGFARTVPEHEYYDEMPMREDGELYEPRAHDRIPPRHRLEAT